MRADGTQRGIWGWAVGVLTLGIVLRLLILPMVWDILSLRPAACTLADPVRVRLDGAVYLLPAAAKPSVIPPLPMGRTEPSGWGICQNTADPPAAVTHFMVLDYHGLAHTARDDARRAALASIYQIVAQEVPRGGGQPFLESEPTWDGAYRRQGPPDGRGDLVAEAITRDGRPITARCGQVGTSPPEFWCFIYGRSAEGRRLRVWLRPMATPTDAWPDIFAAAEAWVDSLRAPSPRH